MPCRNECSSRIIFTGTIVGKNLLYIARGRIFIEIQAPQRGFKLLAPAHHILGFAIRCKGNNIIKKGERSRLCTVHYNHHEATGLRTHLFQRRAYKILNVSHCFIDRDSSWRHRTNLSVDLKIKTTLCQRTVGNIHHILFC